MIIISDILIEGGIFSDTGVVLTNLEITKFCYSHPFTQEEQDIATAVGARVYGDLDDWKNSENWTEIASLIDQESGSESG